MLEGLLPHKPCGVGLCFSKIASVAFRSTKSPSLDERKTHVSSLEVSSFQEGASKHDGAKPRLHPKTLQNAAVRGSVELLNLDFKLLWGGQENLEVEIGGGKQ